MAAGVVRDDEARRRKRKLRNRFLVVAFFMFVGLIVFLESPLTRIRGMGVSGNASIPAKRILKEAGITVGMNIWQINANAIGQAVMSKEPLVERVHVQTDFIHGRVTLHITEKHVVAVFETGGKFYRLLNDGTAFGEVALTTGLEWPIITADEHGLIETGHGLSNGYLSELCDAIAHTPENELQDVSEIHVDKFGVDTVYLDNRFEAQFETADFRADLPSVADAISYFQSHGDGPGLIDMTGSPPYRYTPFPVAKKG